MYAIILLAVLALALIGVQQYAIRKYRRGFSLRDGKNRPRRQLFPDPEEQRMQQWLESEDEDVESPLR